MSRSKQAKPKSTPMKIKEKVRKELSNIEKKSKVKTGKPEKKVKNTTANMSLSMIKHRFKPGEKALKEIRYYQKSADLVIPKLPFRRVVNDITLTVVPPEYLPIRFHKLAIEALQEAAETYLVQFFEDALLCCIHSKRVTIKDVDMHLARRLRGRSDIINM